MLPMSQWLAYFSPETLLPLSSLIATIAGFALLIKRSTIRFVIHGCRAAFRRRPSQSIIKRPHIATESHPVEQEIGS